MVLIVVRKDNHIIDVATCVVFVFHEFLVHVLLHMGGAVAGSHWDDIEPLLTSVAQNSRLPLIFTPEMTLVKGLLEIDNRDTVLSGDAVGDFILEREWIGVGDGFFIEASEVYNWSCLAVLSQAGLQPVATGCNLDHIGVARGTARPHGPCHE
jgi:hypothetical protein